MRQWRVVMIMCFARGTLVECSAVLWTLAVSAVTVVLGAVDLRSRGLMLLNWAAFGIRTEVQFRCVRD